MNSLQAQTDSHSILPYKICQLQSHFQTYDTAKLPWMGDHIKANSYFITSRELPNQPPLPFHQLPSPVTTHKTHEYKSGSWEMEIHCHWT